MLVNQGLIMVASKQQTQVRVCFVLPESSVIHQVCLLLMESVPLDTIAPLDSQLVHQLYMAAQLEVNALKVLRPLKIVNLATIKMNF